MNGGYTRREFLAASAGAYAMTGLTQGTQPLYKISLAEWSINQPLFSGKMQHLDFARIAKSVGIDAIEYVNQFFKDKAKDTAYLGEMKKRADDNGVNRRVAALLLEHRGHSVRTAQDGEEALSMLESDGPFDLAIIDMHMPELSGPEVILRWRFIESGHLPIIMLTADAREDAEHTSQDAGADAFLTKPISSHALIDMIAQLIDKDLQSSSTSRSASAVSEKGEIIDESVLENLALMGGGQSFVQELIESFNSESKRSLREIERALHIEDFGMWHDQLHILKGGASDVGAHTLALVCADAERIKPYEITAALAREKLAKVKSALEQAQTSLALYQASKLRTELA